MATFQANQYQSRQDLEASILSEAGSDVTKNPEALHQIQGTDEELKKLSLSITSTVFGVKVVKKPE